MFEKLKTHWTEEIVHHYRDGFVANEKKPLTGHESAAIDLLFLLLISSYASMQGFQRSELLALSGCLYKIVEYLVMYRKEV